MENIVSFFLESLPYFMIGQQCQMSENFWILLTVNMATYWDRES